MSFFTTPASQKKRKRTGTVATPASKKRSVDTNGDGKGSRGRKERDESISGSDSEEGDARSDAEDDSDDSDEGETAADRRLRLAERYLDNIREEVDEAGFDAADIDRDMIAERLKEDVDEFKGRRYRQIASKLALSGSNHTFFREKTKSTTSVAIHLPYAYTVSKDGFLIKWELAEPSTADLNSTTQPQRKKPRKVRYARGIFGSSDPSRPQGHKGQILTIACSSSGKYVCTGGSDNHLVVWDAETLTPLKTFTQHRDSVAGLAFAPAPPTTSALQNSGEQLFSASMDRTIKTWSISPDPNAHAYVETLFGHQDSILGIAAMTRDQCVSVGSRDRTARLWKVIDETQLVFRGGGSRKDVYVPNTLEVVASLPPNHFLTGSDSGALALWSVHKKKPLHTVNLAHGVDPLPPLSQLSAEGDLAIAAETRSNLRPNPRAITALATVPGTDIVITGSWDGYLKMWKVSSDKRFIEPLGVLGNVLYDAPRHQRFTDDGVVGEDQDAMIEEKQPEPKPLIRGFVNGISIVERRTIPDAKLGPGRKGKSLGFCVVAAIGREPRLGRWKSYGDGTEEATKDLGINGAVVVELTYANANEEAEDDDDEAEDEEVEDN